MKTVLQKSLFIVLIICSFTVAKGQALTGIKTVGGTSPDYTSLSNAIDALNINGVGIGGVIFNIAAGHTETMANKIITTTSGSAGNEIVFQKSGSGANPLITAAAGTSTTLDGIIKIAGADYLTFKEIDLLDPTTNTTTTTQMEWGFAILKGSATNGSQYINIINCSITLQKTNANTKAIYMANHLTTSTTSLSVSSLSGINSNINIYGNTISNSFSGIYSIGATTAAYYDDSLSFGTLGQNIITNFGGSGTSYGIYLQNFANAEISNDSIYNNITPTSSSTYYGIYTGNSNNSNVLIQNNFIQITLNGSQSTRAVYGIYCLNGTAGNYITINNNKIKNCLYGATSTLFSLIYTSSNADISISNNEISGNVRVGTSGQTSYIYSTLTPVNRNIYNNVIYGNKATGTSAKLYAINLANGGGNIYNNTISYDTLTGTSGLSNQIYCAQGDASIFGNTFIGNYSSGTSADGYIIYIAAAGSNPCRIYENIMDGNIHPSSSTGFLANIHIENGGATIYKNTITNSNTAGGDLIGINLASAAGAIFEVYQNKIVGLSSTNNSCDVSAILQSGLSTSKIHNNIIGSISSGPTSTTTNAINGINISSSNAGTEANIYHNSIYFNSTSAGGSNCVLLNTGSTATLANNVLINVSTAGTTAARSACAIRRTSTTFTSYSNESNNNFLSVGPLGTYRFIYYDGTNSFQTIATYQAYALDRDQSSISRSYSFLSTTSSSLDFLKPDSTLPSFFESSGKMLANLFADYIDDSTRMNYPKPFQINGGGTFPDLGAYEMDLIPIDSTGPEINFTPLGKSLISFSRDLNNVTITDPSGINQNTGRVPRLYFKKSTHSNSLPTANNSSADGWKYVETYSSSSPYNFTIDYSLLYGSGTVSDGDIIQYFVVAEDNSTATNTNSKGAILANTTNTVNLSSASFPVSINYSYQIFSTGFPSFVTVADTGADYSSLTRTGGVFEAINNGLITNDVNVLIIGDLTNETGAVVLNKFAEDGFGAGTFKITFQPNSPQLYTIFGSTTTGGMIKIVDAERIIFDGRYFGSGNYLSFNNKAISGNNAVFQIAGINTGSKDITIRNCNIYTDTAFSSGGTGIFIGGNNIGTGTGAAAGFNNKRIQLQQNNISKSYTGILINGLASFKADSIEIIENEIGSDTLEKYIGAVGIYLRGVTNSIIHKNHIYNINNYYTNDQFGIRLMQDVYDVNVSSNKIHNIINTSAGTSAVFGILVNGAANSNMLIKNNIIYSILGQGNASDIAAGPVGLYINSGSHYKVYNNSIVLSGNRLNSAVGSAYTACLFVKGACSNVEVMNNVFKNVMTSSNTVNPGSNFAIFTNNANGNAYTSLNHNCYFANSSTSGLVSALGYMGSVKTDLATWRTFTNKDINSLWGQPGYVSDTIIQVNLLDSNSWNLNGRGYPLIDNSLDLLDVPRSTNLALGAVDIGAFEFTPTVSPANAIASAAPAAGTTTYYTVAQDTIAAIVWASSSLVPSTLDVKYYSGTNPPSPVTNSYMNAYWDFNASPSSSLFYSIKLYYKPEAMRNIENENVLTVAQKTVPSPWVPYLSGLTIIDSLRKNMMVENLSTLSIFTGTSSNNPLPIKLLSFEGKKSEKLIVLNWISASEINAASYEIERAENVSEHTSWLNIGSVKAYGNSQNVISYQFVDKSVIDLLTQNKVVYYRLKMLDFDGSFTYSATVKISQNELENNAEPIVYPNPILNQFEILTKSNSTIDLQIIDVNGKNILDLKNLETDDSGIFRVTVLDFLEAGIYFLNLKIDGVNHFTKVLKQ
jgi:trimeric autotransporter adhesin